MTVINIHKREIIIFIIAIGLVVGLVVFNVLKSNKNSIPKTVNSNDELVELKNRIDILENSVKDLDKKIMMDSLQNVGSQTMTSGNLKEGMIVLKEYADSKFDVVNSKFDTVNSKIESYAECMAFNKNSITCLSQIQAWP